MFDLFQFVADCREAMAADKSQKYVREVVARAVSEPAAVLAALGEPQRAGLHKLYQSRELTVLNVVWAPMMTVMPHNHQMSAVIGIYTGREDNIFWRRIPGSSRKGGGRRRQGAVGRRCRDARSQHHPFGHQSHSAPDRGASCLLRRFLQFRPAQRVGSGNPDRTAVRS